VILLILFGLLMVFGFGDGRHGRVLVIQLDLIQEKEVIVEDVQNPTLSSLEEGRELYHGRKS
jgi:hypothetical protein